MKKVILVLGVFATVGMISCGGYSEEAGKVADEVCDCAKGMDDKGDIKGCAVSAMIKSDKMKEIGRDKDKAEAFAKEIQDAMKDKCPDVYDVIKK